MNPELEIRNLKHYLIIPIGTSPQDKDSEVSIGLSAIEYAVLVASGVPVKI